MRKLPLQVDPLSSGRSKSDARVCDLRPNGRGYHGGGA